MDRSYWEREYEQAGIPPLNPVLVGFNVNLDRIILVSRELLDSEGFRSRELSDLRSHLIHSMEHCTAEEWYVANPGHYTRLTEQFSGYGYLAMGGQAGIAALHLAGLGAPEIICLAPFMGSEAKKMLRKRGVRVPGHDSDSRTDTIHLIFEYKPGLVPSAQGVIPRNNRFIASPKKTAENTLFENRDFLEILPELSTCTRAFLSGYQYLEEEQEFARAAEQIKILKQANPQMRVHIECVSVTDPKVIAGLNRYILPVADSAGMNEHELALLLGHEGNPSPVSLVKSMIDLAAATGIKRIHLHTFGYYLLLVRKEHAFPDASRTALMYAARVVAEAAMGRHTDISSHGLEALGRLAEEFRPGPLPGSFTAGNYQVLTVPTLIASDITKTAGLGDILSSTAFVADKF
jgi:ADP-dependent phosphofructokinase/glucokinase